MPNAFTPRGTTTVYQLDSGCPFTNLGSVNWTLHPPNCLLDALPNGRCPIVARPVLPLRGAEVMEPPN